MSILYYYNTQYLFLQTRNPLFAISRVFGGCHPLSRPTRLLVWTLKTGKHARDVIKAQVKYCYKEE
jgi:hypothetical protein